MAFDHELTLISVNSTENDMGDIIAMESRIEVLCDVESVTRSEHYSASANGLRPEIVFVLNQYDYNKQELVEFEGVKYRVIRSYKSKKSKRIDDLELICEGAVNRATT